MPAGMRVSEHAKEMLAMHLKNVPMSVIAERYQLNKSTVSRAIQKLKELAASQAQDLAVA